MRFTQTSRLIAVAVLLVVATAIAWWGVGYHLGAALVNDASAWHYFSYGASGLVRLVDGWASLGRVRRTVALARHSGFGPVAHSGR